MNRLFRLEIKKEDLISKIKMFEGKIDTTKLKRDLLKIEDEITCLKNQYKIYNNYII